MGLISTDGLVLKLYKGITKVFGNSTKGGSKITRKLRSVLKPVRDI